MIARGPVPHRAIPATLHPELSDRLRRSYCMFRAVCCMLHVAYSMLHAYFACCLLHIARRMLHVARHKFHVAGCDVHATCGMPHAACNMQHTWNLCHAAFRNRPVCRTLVQVAAPQSSHVSSCTDGARLRRLLHIAGCMSHAVCCMSHVVC